MSPLLDPANGEVGANVNRHEDDLGRLARNWKFESIPLQRGVTNEPRGCSKQRRARTVERTRSGRSNPSPSAAIEQIT
jgi:hypothetical protein